MMGSELILALALSTMPAAPALPARNDWVGESVLIRQTNTEYETREADGSFTPAGILRSIQYRVEREEKGKLMLSQDGKPVWVSKDKMVLLKDAVEHYTKMLDENPNNDIWFAFRGWARHRTGKSEEALKDYSEAIRLRPQSPHWYSNRGLIYTEMKKFDDAIADFSTSLEMNPQNEAAYRNRAMAYSRAKKYSLAVTDYEKVIELNPNSSTGYNGLAWLLCTAPDDKVRNGKKALELAKKACELTDYKSGGLLDTLAAAYAEVGEFDKAVEWQQKAVQTGDMPVKDLDAARKRLEMYKSKKPFHGDED